jgi:hypothetical protein
LHPTTDVKSEKADMDESTAALGCKPVVNEGAC